MPTIHLSIPESLYIELKRRAEEVGIQITDLVKMYIRDGLQQSIAKEEYIVEDSRQEELEYLKAKIEQLEKLVISIYKKLDLSQVQVEDRDSA
jgi:hypothetical protein